MSDTEDIKMQQRDESEIGEAINKMFDLVWYGRHQSAKAEIESGKETVDPEIWKQALLAAKKIEKLYSKEELESCYDDFKSGMIHGKLSALRWVFGDEWDFLDT